MKIMFTVQGEGRGHMTQAMAVIEMLRRHGHDLVAVVVGGNPEKPLPDFFTSAVAIHPRRMCSPGFVQRGNRGVSLLSSVAELLKRTSKYRQSLRCIREAIRQTQPDLIINFLEPLMGIYNLLNKPKVPTIAVGHQFMMEHPAYLKINEFYFQRVGMMNYIRITGARSLKLALSFYPAAELPHKNLIVCPPILRRQLLSTTPTAGNRLLVYLLYHGFSQCIIEWSQANPAIPIDCFYDRPNAPAEERHNESLTFHKLDGKKFLRSMAQSRGVVCTAGFESVSEAAYLGKPLLMVPVENHLEQFINAWDAEKTGLGIRDRKFALSRLVVEKPSSGQAAFKSWVDRAEDVFMSAVNRAVKDEMADSVEDFETIARHCAL